MLRKLTLSLFRNSRYLPILLAVQLVAFSSCSPNEGNGIIKASDQIRRLYIYNSAGLPNEAIYSLINSTRLIRFAKDGKSFTPDLCSKWDFEDDGRAIVFTIREDVTWSDGSPVTVSQFTSLDTPIKYQGINTIAENAIIGIDSAGDRQFIIRFAIRPEDPLLDIAGGTLGEWLLPVRENVEADVTIHPWQLAPINQDNEQRWIRNSRYHVTTLEGEYLPFFDEIIIPTFSEIPMKNGSKQTSLTFVSRDFSFNGDYPDSTALVPVRDTYSGNLVLLFNQTNPNTSLAAVFRDRRFRRAVSLALDRKELSLIAPSYDFKPIHIVPPKVDPWAQPSWETMYTFQRVYLAKELISAVINDAELEEIEPFKIQVSDMNKQYIQVASRIAEQLSLIGLSVNVEVLSMNDFLRLDDEGEAQATLTSGGVGRWNLKGYLPITGAESRWGQAWSLWLRSNGESGEKPPPEYLDIDETVKKIAYSNWEREKERLSLDLYWLLTQSYPMVGILGEPITHWIVIEGNIASVGTPWYRPISERIIHLDLRLLSLK